MVPGHYSACAGATTAETKAVNFLGSVDLYAQESADAILNSFGQTTDESLTIFIQYILVLVSTPNHVIKTAAMKMLYSLSLWCSPNIRLALVKADLLPQIVINLNLQSLSFAEAVDIHIHIMKIIRISAWLTAPDGLDQLEIEDHDEQQAVYKTVLKQVLVPSEKYICYLCANRYSMNDETQSESFVLLLATLLRISPSYQPTMDFVLHMPVVLTIPSCLTYSRSDC
ncbi:hypothetical protein BLNAU_9823 [Blattamonas nauphoetae]|uniref:Uncharacterized protein n=1 Tax=Blattamonas nauphoetae TaxID=2049346 RepID=A0ABQ9XUV8_9EUKA|nr:hypothetical protein BLNAU_9823 [Blattamonas nauphoetae]